ncbi:MAG: glycosyltransferase family 39 protein [Anaerolineales bacterium]|nr:glycosyltransferase family 39 protein [Anaerolineales bacterium]
MKHGGTAVRRKHENGRYRLAGEPARLSLRAWIGENGLLLLAAGIALVHALTNGQYGFHRDELDILMNARQLDWGYVAYPPLTPFVARIGLALFGDWLPGLRLFSAMGQGVAALLVGLMARDLGGGRAAQLLAALAAAAAPAALMAGTLIQYMSFDYLWWVLLSFCLVRLIHTDDARWWLGAGAAIGLGMMTKYTLAFFVAGVVTAVFLTSLRRHLRSPWLWAGAGLALLLYLPNLLWQVQHDFIALDFLGAIHERDVSIGRTDTFLLDQLYVANNPFFLPLWLAGLLYCWLHPVGKRFRALGWAFVVSLALFWAARGRGYYLAPAYAMLVAAGAVWWEGWLRGRAPRRQRLGWRFSWLLAGLAGAAGLVLVKPIVPINSALWSVTSRVNSEVTEMLGWPDLVAQVAAVYETIPEAERARTAVLAGNYGEAGALDLYGPAYGLPRVISGSNSLWARGYGDPEPETVIVVGFQAQYATLFFKSCRLSGRVTNRYDVPNEETTRHTGLYVCRQPRQPWAQMWPRMQWFQ